MYMDENKRVTLNYDDVVEMCKEIARTDDVNSFQTPRLMDMFMMATNDNEIYAEVYND